MVNVEPEVVLNFVLRHLGEALVHSLGLPVDAVDVLLVHLLVVLVHVPKAGSSVKEIKLLVFVRALLMGLDYCLLGARLFLWLEARG
jgi:hypothetical protein